MAVHKLGEVQVLAGRVKGVCEGVADTLEEEYPLVPVEPQNLRTRQGKPPFSAGTH